MITLKSLGASVALATALMAMPMASLAYPAALTPAQADAAQAPRARNVIIFLADAGGVSTLNAASLMAYDAPLKLAIQSWPHLGLSDASPVDAFVSDSANGMSSIMTGVKTRNGVISQGPDAVRGQRPGDPTKTLLEYAEERGLLTGVVSSQSIADATPAATYAHSDDRARQGEIFVQAFSPRFGDGVDVLLGAGRRHIGEQLTRLGASYEGLTADHDRAIYASLEVVNPTDTRPIVVADRIDVRAATLKALDLLEPADNGYLLVVEWDAHTDDVRQGLQNVVDFDRLAAEVVGRVNLDDTLVIFTADHSFGVMVDGGQRGEPLLEGYEEWKASGSTDGLVRLDSVLINRSHTAEEVPALAIGRGAERVRGYFPNTYLFEVVMKAWGWPIP